MTNNFEHLSDREFEEIKKVFYSQAYEIVEELQDSVLRLETDPEDDISLKAVKRYIHTLKGDSNSFGLTSVGTLCHRVEDILSFLMDGSRHAEHEAVDLLLSCVDVINRLLLESESGIDEVQSSHLGESPEATKFKIQSLENGTDIKEIMKNIDGFLAKSPEFGVVKMSLRGEAEAISKGEIPREVYPFTSFRASSEQDDEILPLPLHFVQGQGQNDKRRARNDIFGANYTEYHQLQIQDAMKKGFTIYEMEIVFHPMCADKGSAAFMVMQKLNGKGQVINSVPPLYPPLLRGELEGGGSDIDNAERMTILFSSKLTGDEIKEDTFITGITLDINVTPHARPQSSEFGVQDMERPLSPNTGLPPSGLKGGSKLKSEMLRVEVSKVDRMMNLVGELIIGRSMIDQVAKDIVDGALTKEIEARLFAANSYMERTVSDLQKGIMKMRMVPIDHVFRRFPKIVRDLSAEKGKQVRLDVRGEETELDKGIVDTLGEPLSHIIRNFIDHGIEEPGYRRSIGKPEEGVITLNAYHEAAQIVIEASDDGRGIDLVKLRERAIEKGFLNEGEVERLSDAEAMNLIFISGLSTSETVSETSGRGVGMDAVKSAVDSMKGSVEVESTPGRGTKFRLRLPLTLAVIKALLFEVGERLYAVPISVIANVTRIMMDDLVTVDGRDTLILRDRIISIINLRGLFGITRQNVSPSPNPSHQGRGTNAISPLPFVGEGGGEGEFQKKFALILGIGDRNVGLLIDRLVGQQELVIKAVDAYYTQSDLLAGASILGNGRVVLILDAPAIFKKAVEEEKTKITLPFIPSHQGRGSGGGFIPVGEASPPVPSPLVGEASPPVPSPLVGEG